MLIPKQFQLMAHTWTVEHVPGMITDPADGGTCRGLCEFEALRISINVAQPQSMVLHTFMHEVMHAVLWTLGRAECENELFVDAVGGGLAQVFESAQERG
jgi:hypothetical protein